jgi:hypothetical protein
LDCVRPIIGQRTRPWAGGGDPERDRIAGIDQTEFGVKQPDQPLLPFDFGLDRVSAQQRHDHADVFFHIGELDRAQPHCPPASETGPDAEIDPPGANLFSEAKAFAVTGAIRFDGINTPVPSRILVVLSAAAAIATNGSALSICVS